MSEPTRKNSKMAERLTFYMEDEWRRWRASQGRPAKPGELFQGFLVALTNPEIRHRACERLKEEETQNGGPSYWDVE